MGAQNIFNTSNIHDVYWNKPFKVRMTELYDPWLSEAINQLTEVGNGSPLLGNE